MKQKKIKVIKKKEEFVSFDEYVSFEKTKYLSESLPPLEKWTIDIANDLKKKKKWILSAKSYIKAYIMEGYTREEIIKSLGINETHYDSIERDFLDIDAGKFIGMGTAHRYFLFALANEGCIRQLDDVIKEGMKPLNTNKSYVVSAIRAKSQIAKETITVGQELGIVEKRANEMRLLGEINLAMMQEEELRKLYKNENKKFDYLIENTNELPNAYGKLVSDATKKSEEIIDAEYEEE